MLHNLLIAAHAACGLAAFALGVIVRRPRASGASPLFQSYLGALWLMVVLLIAVVAVDWGTIVLAVRVLYGALTALALYTGWRGWHALRALHSPAVAPGDYVEDVGFTLITLFDGFVIISALDLGSPVWLVVIVGVLGVLVGRLGVQRVKEGAAA